MAGTSAGAAAWLATPFTASRACESELASSSAGLLAALAAGGLLLGAVAAASAAAALAAATAAGALSAAARRAGRIRDRGCARLANALLAQAFVLCVALDAWSGVLCHSCFLTIPRRVPCLRNLHHGRERFASDMSGHAETEC